MANLFKGLELVLPAFEAWYEKYHGLNEDYYIREMTHNYLASISDKEFIDFFVNFRKEGGRIQSGGGRSLDTFRAMVRSKLNKFRKYILMPFYEKFSIDDWFEQRKCFRQWGFGIATIYLVRVNKYKYAVLNRKTVNALIMLGFENVTNMDARTYFYVIGIQKRIIREYPEVNNLYKADALFHYIYTERENDKIRKNLVNVLRESRSILMDDLEHERVALQVQTDKQLSDNKRLIDRIKEIESGDSEFVVYTGKQCKRNTYVQELIKYLRGYKCQFCGVSILKQDGSLYVEACHIKQKAEGGNESISNILILCPNCHKEFDLGDRKVIEHNRKRFVVDVNGSRHTILFEG